MSVFIDSGIKVTRYRSVKKLLKMLSHVVCQYYSKKVHLRSSSLEVIKDYLELRYKETFFCYMISEERPFRSMWE